MADLKTLYGTDFADDPMLRVEALARADLVERILALKREKDVLILGHNYMHPLVYRLSDEGARGDSLALSMYAARTDKPAILFDGVLFMAETAKILNPSKKVLIADKSAGCSLADPIRRKDVIAIKARVPGVPVVTYINSYADVKAETDIVCTSANAIDVILSTGSERVIFLPDSLMGANLQGEIDAKGLGVELIYPGKDNAMAPGKCEVHDQFRVEHLQEVRAQWGIPKGHPRRAILAHWECRPEVIQEADFHGSTSQMAAYIRDRRPERVFLATECEMAANLSLEFPQTEFIRQCNMYCQHMRKITLAGILEALECEDPERHVVTVEEDVRKAALIPIERMLALGRK